MKCRFRAPAPAEQPTNANVTVCRDSDDPNDATLSPTVWTCTEARFVNESVATCAMPRLSTLGKIPVSVSVDGGESYSSDCDNAGTCPLAVHLAVVETPAGIVLNSTVTQNGALPFQLWEVNDERIWIEITASAGWGHATSDRVASLLHVRVGGVTRPVHPRQPEAGSAPYAVAELPKGLIPAIYTVQVSADGGVTFLPPDTDDERLTLEVKACPAGSECS